MKITTATEWADAIDAYQQETRQSAGDIVSFGYADGQVCNVVLDPNHPAADDERAIIASQQGWVVAYNREHGWWEATTA